MSLGREKIALLYTPTPLEFLPTMSEKLGIKLYIKRDDLTPLGAGGNKLRKLEYFLADAKAKGATRLLTTGDAQTNHGRLTAAVAAKYGMNCTIACIDRYPGEVSANLLLDRIMGADIVLKQDDGREESQQVADLFAELTATYEAQGETVYPIPWAEATYWAHWVTTTAPWNWYSRQKPCSWAPPGSYVPSAVSAPIWVCSPAFVPHSLPCR